MSTAHKIAITVAVLFIGLAATPAAVTAVEFPSNDGDWQKSYGSNDDANGGSYTPIKTVYVDSGPDNIQFRAVLNNSTLDNDGLEGDKDAIQIYVDTGEGGIDADTGSSNGWGNFFDGLGAMNADYRITAQPGSAVVEEHQTDIFFNTESSFSETSNGAYQLQDDSGTDDDIRFSLDRETIGNPDTLDVKFAYIDNRLGESSIENSEFNWAPESPIRIGGGDGDSGVGQTATVTTEVQFGDEPVDSDATVNIVLNDDSGAEAGSAEVTGFTGSGTLTRDFTVDPANFNGGEAEFSVEVTGDDDYTFEREVDSTKSIGGVDGGGSTSGTLDISTLEVDVNFDTNNLNPSDEAAVEFTLTDESGTETTRVVEEGLSGTLSEVFTVNAANFDGTDANLKVEVVGDESVPFTGTKDPLSVSSGNGRHVTFDPTGVQYEFRLSPPSNTEITGDSDTFTVDVKLESTDKNIHTVDHRINFDDTNLVDEEDGLSDINVTKASGLPSSAFVRNLSVEGDGVVRVVVASTDDTAIVSAPSQKKLYDIKFEYEDGLKAELPEANDAIEFSPSTGDATEIMDQSDNTLNFISSAGTVTVKNTEQRITSAEVTHLSEYANMDEFESFEYEVTVETNDAAVDKINLSSDAITDPSGETEQCDNNDNDNDASTCTVTFELTPDSDTYSGTYNDAQLDIDAVMDSPSSSLDITAQNEGVTSDDLNVIVYQTGDFAGTSDKKNITVDDITRGVDSYLGEEAAGETWGADQQGGAATYDVNGDREVGITDITTIIDEYNS
jgi:hypothetical protein